MPQFELSPGTNLFYRDDSFADPWCKPEAALFLHGASESGVAWNGWMPHYGRCFRVIRPDMRGFGASTPMPVDYPWSFDGVITDFVRLMDSLGIERFHLAGAKIGGGIALRFAATHPERVLSLAVAGARVLGRTAAGGQIRELITEWEKTGCERWLRESMPDRLGRDSSPEMLEGWVQLMARTPLSTHIGFLTNVPAVDIQPDLPQIACPTIVLTPQNNAVKPVDETRSWQERIPRSELFVVPANSFHIAVTHPDACAKAALAYIDREAPRAG